MDRGGTITWYLTALDTDFENTADRVEKRSDKLGRDVDQNINRGVKKANKGLDEFRIELAKTASVVRNFQVATRGFNMTSVVIAALAAGGAITELAAALASTGGAAIALPGIIAPIAGAIGTVKTAVVGLEDAFDAVLKGKPEKLAEAMEKLSPAAREVVRAFQDINKAFDPVRRAVQDAFFDDLGKQMRGLSETYLPLLKDGMVDVAEAINGVAKEAAAVAKEPFFQNMIKDSLETTATATNTLQQAVRPLAESLAGLVQIGLPYTNMLAQWVVDQSRLLSAYVNSAAGQQELTNAINAGVDALQKLGDLAGSVIGLLNTIFQTSNAAGISFIVTLTGIIDKMNAWLQTAEGQAQFIALLEVTNRVISTLATVIGGVLNVVFELVEAFNQLPVPVQNVVITFLAFVAVLTPIVTYFTALGGSLEFVKDTFLAFGGPVVAIIALLGGLAFALGGTSEASVRFQEFFSSIPGIITNFMNQLPTFIGQITGFITQIINQIIAGLPMLIQVGGEILIALVNGLLAAIPSLLSGLGEIFKALVSAIVAFLPKAAEAFARIVDSLLGSIQQNLPMIIQAGMQLLQTLLNGILTALPVLIQTAISLIQTLITALIQAAPMLIQAAIQIILALVNFLVQNIGQIITVAVQLVNTILDAIIGALPLIIEAAIAIILALVMGLIDNLPKIIEATIQLIGAIAKALIDNLPQILEALLKIIILLAAYFTANIPRIIQVVGTLISRIGGRIVSGIPEILGNLGQLLGRMVNALLDASPQWVRGAADMIGGLIRGLSNGAGQVINKVREIASGALDAIKKFFGIHSPSRVMAQMGDYMMEGLQKGIQSTGDAVIRASSTVAEGIASAFARPLDTQNLSANTSINTDIAGTDDLSRTIGAEITSPQTNTASAASAGAVINQTNIVNTEIDMDQVNRNLIWELNKL